MTADLSQSKYLRVLSSDKLYDILNDLDQLEATNFSAEILQEISQRGRISHVIYGNLNKAGDNFRINITIKNPLKEELIGSEVVEGRGEESIFPMVDDLTTRIKQKFAFSDREISSDIDQRVADITTSSPEAYKYYTLAAQAHDRRDYRESINHLEKAVAIDPEFAFAYRTMAINYGNMGYWFERRENLKKAMQLSHRVSTREKYLIQGDYHFEFDKPKAISAYENLLVIYPYDVTGNINLGFLYNSLRELNKAINCFKNAIKGDPSVFTAYMNSAWAYTELAQYDSALYILGKYKDNYQDNEIIQAYYSELHLYEHEYDLALMEIERALAFKPDDYDNFQLKGDIYLCMDQLDSAKKIYRQLLTWDEKIAHIKSRVRLWSLAALLGKTKEMKKQVQAGLELTQELGEKGWESSFYFREAEVEKLTDNYQEALQIYDKIITIAEKNNLSRSHHWALHYRGEMLAKLNHMEEAKQVAERLREINLNDLDKKWNGNYLFLKGKIAMIEQDYNTAVDSILQAIQVLAPNPESFVKAYMYFHLAQAYEKAGQPDQAIEWYNRLTHLTIGRVTTGHKYAQSFYFLGRIYQKKGWRGKAIEKYEKFLDLWRGSDYVFPELEDARQQIKLLGTTS
jgi:tetratricopeptide (TPR) repeat protein